MDKIQRIAEENGVTPKEYVDKIVAGIKDLWKLMDISYDRFIRTTDDYHVKAVQDIFNKLHEQGIFTRVPMKAGIVHHEAFWTETQLNDGKCPDCGRAVEKARKRLTSLK